MFGVVFRTWSLASWSLKRSRLASSIYITGQVFQFSTGLHYQWRKHAGTPKYAFMAREMVLLDVGACVRWSETVMSTRLWTIQYIMVTRAFTRETLVLVQPFTSSVVTVACGSHATLWVFNDGSFLHRSWCSAQVMLEESIGVGFLCCLVDMLRPRYVFMERYASVLGSVSFC